VRASSIALRLIVVAATIALFPRVAWSAPPAADFGSPPSGEVPILFNDHHVYSKPDKLKQGRVLAALVRGSTILIPLRSMFEQMGATVSYDASTKTVDVTKPGSDVKVTVGKPEVVINAETRPLDVPPEIYQGSVVVPVRVISEGMGAYVQWVPDKRLVVVRYIPATPPPTPAPTLAPTEAPLPTPTPSPSPKPYYYEKFIAADYIISPKVYNELANGISGKNSFDVKGGFEFPTAGITLMLDSEFRQFQYDHPSQFGNTACNNPGSPGCQTVIGGNGNYRLGTCPNAADPGCVTVIGYQKYVAQTLLGQAYVPRFLAQERDVDVSLGLKVSNPRVYLAASYYGRDYNYLGYPTIKALGFGLDKLPDLDQPWSLYGNIYFYPNTKGTYVGPTSFLLGSLSGASFNLEYNILRYEVGGTYNIGKTPLYAEAGFLGDQGYAHADAPAGFSHSGFFIGGGLRF
jgi:Copper amine oxidase N-terminal domain